MDKHKWFAIGPNLTRFNMDMVKLPGTTTAVNAIELNTTTNKPSSTLDQFICDKNEPTLTLDELSKTHGETITAFDTGYEHHVALTITNRLVFGGANHRQQSFSPIQNVRLFCCTGWATAWLTKTNEFGLTGFDFDEIAPLRAFSAKHRIRFMAGGAHHIMLVGDDNVVLIVTNRPKRLIQFSTTQHISAISSSLYDCFIRLAF